MTFDELGSAIGSVSYKPGWTAWVCRENVGGAPGGAVIYMRHEVADASGLHPGHLIPVVLPFSIHAGLLHSMNLDRLLQVIVRTVRDLEQHEMDEWLRFDGRLVRNPHPEIAGYDEPLFRDAAAVTKGDAP